MIIYHIIYSLPQSLHVNVKLQNGDQKVLAQIVEDQGICATSKRGIDILHLCALGGFPKSLEFLLSTNVRANIIRMADYSFGELAAVCLLSVSFHSSPALQSNTFFLFCLFFVPFWVGLLTPHIYMSKGLRSTTVTRGLAFD